MPEQNFLAPVMALVLWTLVIWLWMYATRIPAMQKAKIDPQVAARTRTLDLPPEIMWVSDNYNHLMEQPTIFYATALAGQISGQVDGLTMTLAWAYVVLRIAHSLVQCTVNNVTVRFTLFTLSTIALAILAVRIAVFVF